MIALAYFAETVKWTSMAFKFGSWYLFIIMIAAALPIYISYINTRSLPVFINEILLNKNSSAKPKLSAKEMKLKLDEIMKPYKKIIDSYNNGKQLPKIIDIILYLSIIIILVVNNWTGYAILWTLIAYSDLSMRNMSKEFTG